MMELSIFESDTLGGVYATPAALRVVTSGTATPGNSFTAFIAVDSPNSNVAAFGGTLEFDPAVLANPRGQLVGGETAAIGMVLTENKNAVDLGRYGFLADGGGNLPAGRINVIMVVFDVLAAGSPRLKFSNSVITCSTSDWDADLVPTDYYDSNGMKQSEIPRFPSGAGVNPGYRDPSYLGPPIADHILPSYSDVDKWDRPVTAQPPSSGGGAGPGPTGVPAAGGGPSILSGIVGADGKIFGLSPLAAIAIGIGALYLFSGGGGSK